MARSSNDLRFRMVLGQSASGPIRSYCRISEARNLKNWHPKRGGRQLGVESCGLPKGRTPGQGMQVTDKEQVVVL
jgi:hypothetical protein